MIKMQILSLSFSLFILYFTFKIVKDKKMKEEYSILWFFMGLVFLVISIYPELINILGNLFGIAYPPTLIILLIIAFILAILIHFSIVISRLQNQNKDLIQEIGLLKNEIKLDKNT